MKPDWISFDEAKGDDQELPSEKRYVLLQIDGDDRVGMPPRVVVGYMKFAAGERDSPRFHTPGCNFAGPENDPRPKHKVLYWADCLGDDFNALPSWQGRQGKMVEAAEDIRKQMISTFDYLDGCAIRRSDNIRLTMTWEKASELKRLNHEE